MIGNDAMFTPNEAVKVDRREVEEVIELCTRFVGDDQFLRADYEAMWHPVARLMAAGSTTTGAIEEMDAA